MVYVLPTYPSDLGFDHTMLPSWREHQAGAIERILNSTKKLVIASAPTGAGKSPIAMAIAKVMADEGYKTTILTSSKELQDQYMALTFATDELDAIQPVTAKGRSNYPCILDGVDFGTTAATAPCTEGYKCMHASAEGEIGDCPFYYARDIADIGPIRVLNYPFFILEASFQGIFDENRILICDEGHKVDKEILRAAIAELDWRDMEYLIDIGGYKPRVLEPLLKRNPQIFPWAEEMWHLIHQKQEDNNGRATPRMRRMMDTLSRIERLRDKMVVIDQSNNGLKFSPCLPEEFAEDFLLRHAEKTVLLSATIFSPEYWAGRFGLEMDDVEFIEIPSTFPPDRRRFFYAPVLQMNNKVWQNSDEIEEKMIPAIDYLIAHNLPANGIIHTVSRKLAEFITTRSKFGSIMVMGGGSDVAKFKAATEKGPAVFVSYSALEGLDLPDDLCRYVIFAKVPWPPKGDPVIEVQMEEIPGFYPYEAISGIVQGAGRGMRHKDDWCITYMLDKSFGYLWKQTKDIVPSWFREAYSEGRLN